MKWFLILTATVAALLLLAFLAGMVLPKEHTARVSGRVPATPDDVWKTMTEPEGFPEWRPGVQDVEVLDRDSHGPVRWIERAKAGSMTLEVVERRPAERLVLRIVDSDLPLGGRWTYALEPEGRGTRVAITEDGEIYNPIFRFTAHCVLGHEAAMRDYLEGLERRMTAGGG